MYVESPKRIAFGGPGQDSHGRGVDRDKFAIRRPFHAKGCGILSQFFTALVIDIRNYWLIGPCD